MGSRAARPSVSCHPRSQSAEQDLLNTNHVLRPLKPPALPLHLSTVSRSFLCVLTSFQVPLLRGRTCSRAGTE